MPKDSKLNSIADLKGKKVALNKGSNVHYLLVKALEKAGVKYSEIEPAFLAPADARAAFERGAVDAWVIWDPFQAAAEAATGARILADGTGIVSNYQFYFASKKFFESDPKIVDLVLAQLSALAAPAAPAAPATALRAENASGSVPEPAPVVKFITTDAASSVEITVYGRVLWDSENNFTFVQLLGRNVVVDPPGTATVSW